MKNPGPLMIFAGPLAWFAELSIGYAMATQPCRAGHWAGTGTGLLGLAVLCMLIALLAFALSLSALRQQGAGLHSATAAGSRPRFSALWGVSLGGGFFVATLLTGVGLIMLPRCGG